MSEPRRLIIVAKQREFDEEKWKQLLMAMAYLLHEQRKAQTAKHGGNEPNAQTLS
jgi:hypothetical protein